MRSWTAKVLAGHSWKGTVMTSIRSSIALGVMMVALGGSSATAADLDGGSVKDGYIPAPSMIAEPMSSGLYVRVDGAHASYDNPIMVEDHIYDLVDTNIGNAWSVGFGIGRYFGNGFRGDVTYEYRTEADVSGTLLNHAATLDGEREFGLRSHLVLANLYYDFNAGGRFSPYLGVGLGWARNMTTMGAVSNDCGCTGIVHSGASDSVAAALMAGVTVNLTAGRGGQVSYGGSTKDAPIVTTSNRGLLLDFGYRFLYLGDVATGPVQALGFASDGSDIISDDPVVENIHAHEFRLGLRYNLN